MLRQCVKRVWCVNSPRGAMEEEVYEEGKCVRGLRQDKVIANCQGVV